MIKKSVTDFCKNVFSDTFIPKHVTYYHKTCDTLTLTEHNINDYYK